MTTTGPVALVAGGSRGLGLLIARELGRRGFRPVLWARDAEELDRAVLALSDEGIHAGAMVCDVRDADLVQEQLTRVEDELGPVEVAVHVAGVIEVGPLASLTRAHFEEAIGIMQWGPINLALALVPRMRARGRGRFGVIASVGGLVSVPHLLPYSTAKFAAVVDLPSSDPALLIMMVRARRVRFASSSVAFNRRTASASPLCGLASIAGLIPRPA